MKTTPHEFQKIKKEEASVYGIQCGMCGAVGAFPTKRDAAKAGWMTRFDFCPECKRKRKREYMREYSQLPDVKERNREAARKYSQRPEVRERNREAARKYSQRPDVKERNREAVRKYSQRPDVKERRREYMREYRKNKK